MMAAASLELSGISKRYPGVQALNGVDFECRPGEIHAVLGENGSGKSTLLGIAAGAVAADEGRVAIMGKAAGRRRSAASARTGPGGRLSGRFAGARTDASPRTCCSARWMVRRASAESGEWAARQLAPYGLEISPDALVGQLTASQRQFLEIVKALAANPKVLLLDEPTSSLDISGVEKLSDIIRRIVAAGAAVVYVSHRLPEIFALANRVTILRDGVGPGHLRRRRAAFGKRSHRVDGRSPDRNGISREIRRRRRARSYFRRKA